MNKIGEVNRLAKKVKPNLVLITNAQRDHQEFLDSVFVTANENGMAIKSLQVNGTSVIPADSDHEEIWLDQARSVGSDVVHFGIHSEGSDLFTEKNKYVFIPLETTDQGWGRMDYYTTMGVRDGETDWKKKLNKFIKENQKDIDAILAKHNIPVLSLKPGKRKKADETTTDALIKGRAPVR